MRSEETLSAKGKKRERHTGKKGYGGRREAAPPSSQRPPTDDPRGPAAFSPHTRAPAAERQLTGTTRVCERGKFLPAPWRTTQDSPCPRTCTQSAGDLGVPGVGTGGHLSTSCTGGHNMDTHTHQRQAVRVQAARRGGARLPQRPQPAAAPASRARRTARPLPGSCWLT